MTTDPGRYLGSPATVHNDLSGATCDVVQARQVGCVPFRQPIDEPDLPPRQLLADVRGVRRPDG